MRVPRLVLVVGFGWMGSLLPGLVRAQCDPFLCAGPGTNPCTIYQCVGDQCIGTPKDCDDGDVCTDDGCDPRGVGCTHTPHCPDDGLTCNGQTICFRRHLPFGDVIGVCLPGNPPACEDRNLCTLDSCAEPGGCQHLPVNCDDGNPCTTDGCDPATGCSHTPVANCCRTGADCPGDLCSARRCEANVCGA